MKLSTLILILMAMFWILTCQKREELSLNKDEIINTFYQENIETVSLMEEYISFSEFTKKDFVDSLNLKDDLDFNIRVFLGKDIAYQLNGLEPTLSVNEGNYFNKKMPNGLGEYAYKNLFKPLEIQQYKWQYNSKSVSNTMDDIQLRYGYFCKSESSWKAQNIIPIDWLHTNLAKQVTLTEKGRRYYDYPFWNKQFQVNGKPYKIAFISGNEGNNFLLFKDLPLVIVITIKTYNQADTHFQIDEIISDYTLPTVVNSL